MKPLINDMVLGTIQPLSVRLVVGTIDRGAISRLTSL